MRHVLRVFYIYTELLIIPPAVFRPERLLEAGTRYHGRQQRPRFLFVPAPLHQRLGSAAWKPRGDHHRCRHLRRQRAPKERVILQPPAEGFRQAPHGVRRSPLAASGSSRLAGVGILPPPPPCEPAVALLAARQQRQRCPTPRVLLLRRRCRWCRRRRRRR